MDIIRFIILAILFGSWQMPIYVVSWVVFRIIVTVQKAWEDRNKNPFV